MKKMVISMGIVFTVICGMVAGHSMITKSYQAIKADSYQRIAEAYVASEGITYDNVYVREVYTEGEDECMRLAVYDDGDFTNWITVDVSYAENAVC